MGESFDSYSNEISKLRANNVCPQWTERRVFSEEKKRNSIYKAAVKRARIYREIPRQQLYTENSLLPALRQATSRRFLYIHVSRKLGNPNGGARERLLLHTLIISCPCYLHYRLRKRGNNLIPYLRTDGTQGR